MSGPNPRRPTGPVSAYIMRADEIIDLGQTIGTVKRMADAKEEDVTWNSIIPEHMSIVRAAAVHYSKDVPRKIKEPSHSVLIICDRRFRAVLQTKADDALRESASLSVHFMTVHEFLDKPRAFEKMILYVTEPGAHYLDYNNEIAMREMAFLMGLPFEKINIGREPVLFPGDYVDTIEDVDLGKYLKADPPAIERQYLIDLYEALVIKDSAVVIGSVKPGYRKMHKFIMTKNRTLDMLDHVDIALGRLIVLVEPTAGFGDKQGDFLDKIQYARYANKNNETFVTKD